MARPTKAIKRQEKLTLYYTKAEFKMIEKFSDRHGISKAEFARYKSLDHRIRPRLTVEEAGCYRKLAGMANNLNQLTKAANTGRVFTRQIWKALEGINNVINKLQ